jgi:type II secretory pathway pseudopilin PulG
MRQLLSDRRRAQAGTTLVELLVSLTIAALALGLIVGTLSTGLLNATLAKRNTAAQAVMQYEMEKIGASAFDSSAQNYSECFATEAPTSPALAARYRAACPTGVFSVRADVSWQWLPSSTSVQVWTIGISGWPSGASIGASVQLFKVAHL